MTSETDGPGDGLDETVLEQLVALGVMTKVGHLYLENSRGLIDKGRTAAQRGDFDDVAKIFHTLKSSSAMVGAMALSQLCNQMEAMAHEGNGDECQALLPRLLDSHRKTVDSLETYLMRSQRDQGAVLSTS